MSAPTFSALTTSKILALPRVLMEACVRNGVPVHYLERLVTLERSMESLADLLHELEPKRTKRAPRPICAHFDKAAFDTCFIRSMLELPGVLFQSCARYNLSLSKLAALYDSIEVQDSVVKALGYDSRHDANYVVVNWLPPQIPVDEALKDLRGIARRLHAPRALTEYLSEDSVYNWVASYRSGGRSTQEARVSARREAQASTCGHHVHLYGGDFHSGDEAHILSFLWLIGDGRLGDGDMPVLLRWHESTHGCRNHYPSAFVYHEGRVSKAGNDRRLPAGSIVLTGGIS